MPKGPPWRTWRIWTNRKGIWVGAVTWMAMTAIVAATRQLEHARDGLVISSLRLGSIPVTVFRPAPPAGQKEAGAPAPVAVIAHGFAGSQQLMQPLAITLARNGFEAITFDFPGHGRNTAPMLGGLADMARSSRTLLASLDQVGQLAREHASTTGGHYAVVGHSMGSDLVVRHAQAHPEVLATVGVSLFAPSIAASTPTNSPRNLLVIDGALEPAMMSREALRVVGRGAGAGRNASERAEENLTYGRFEDGSARRATLSPGVEHIAVLYSRHTLAETLGWLDTAFGRPRPPHPFIDAPGPWLGLLMAGVVALAWPLSQLLPRVVGPAGAPTQRARWGSWRGDLPLTLGPALLTPLLMWKLPSSFLPILLGDYLILHFAVYGLLTMAGLAWQGRWPPRVGAGRGLAFGVAVACASAYALLAVGLPVNAFMFNLQPTAARLPMIGAMCLGTLPYFLADEWLTHGAAAAAGVRVISKLCFLLSLVVAIVLNPQRLFFLAIIVPAILLLFIVYGLFSRWAFQGSGHPAVGAIANALAFGSFIALTFPIVG